MNQPQEMMINAAALAELSDLPDFLRKIVLGFVDLPLPIGKWLPLVGTPELLEVLHLGRRAQTAEQPRLFLTLLGLLLATNEGLPVEVNSNVNVYAQRLLLFVQCELRAREGYLDFNRSRATLEMPDPWSICHLTELGKEKFGEIRVQTLPPSTRAG